MLAFKLYTYSLYTHMGGFDGRVENSLIRKIPQGLEAINKSYWQQSSKLSQNDYRRRGDSSLPSATWAAVKSNVDVESNLLFFSVNSGFSVKTRE